MILSPACRRKKSSQRLRRPRPAKRKKKSNSFTAFALVLLSALPAFAQNRTQLLDVRVTDAAGGPVTGLTAADFEVSLDGRPQQIVDSSYITGVSEKRRTVFLVDDLNLSSRGAEQVRQVLQRYVDQQTQPGDETVIMRSSSSNGAQQQFTADLNALREAIDRIQPRHFAGPSPDSLFAIGTMGTLDLAFEGLRPLSGRKSVVLFTEANPAITGSLNALLEKANRAFAVFYAINPAGADTTFEEASPSIAANARRSVTPLMATAPAAPPNSVFESLAKATGGLVVDRAAASGFARVLEDRQGYYLLRYSRDFAIFRPGTGEQLVSHVTVKTARDGLTIRARDGFPDTSPVPVLPANTDERLIDALYSPFSSASIRFGLDSIFLHTAREGPVLKLTLHVDGRDITFRKTVAGVYRYGIDTAIMTLGDGGQSTVHARVHFGEAPMTEAQHREALERGTTFEIRVILGRAGSYQLRLALSDMMSGRTGSANRFVYLPDVASGKLILSSIALSGSIPADPPVIRPKPDEPLFATYEIYNLSSSEVNTQVRLMRGPTEITSPAENTLQFGPSEDPTHRSVTTRLNLGKSLPPGDYTLQLQITDTASHTATGELPFEVR
jgi:VWFA-related protein